MKRIIFPLLFCILNQLQGQSFSKIPVGLQNKELLQKSAPLKFKEEFVSTVKWQPIDFAEKELGSVSCALKIEKEILFYTNQTELKPKISILNPPAVEKLKGFKTPDFTNVNLKYINTLAGLPTNNIKSVTVDDKNNIWAVYSEGVIKLSGSYLTKYTNKNGFPDIIPTQIKFLNNKIYITTFGSGLFCIDGDILTHYSIETGLATNHILDVEFYNSQLYLATYNKGIICIGENQQRRIGLNVIDSNTVINHLRVFKNTLSFATSKGIFGFIDKAQLTKYYLPDFSTRNITHCFEGKNYTYVSIEEVGILVLTGTRAKLLKSESLKDISQIFLAKSENLWVAVNGAIILLRGDKLLKVFKSKSILSEIKVTGFCQDKQSNLWLSTSNFGISLMFPSNFGVLSLSNLTRQESQLLFQTKNSELFIEYKEGGLLKIRPDGSREFFKSVNFKRITGATYYEGSSYFSTYSGLFRLKENKLSKIEFTEDKGFNTHTNITSSGNELYISNYNYGVIIFKNNNFQYIKNTSTYVNKVFVDGEKRIWIANHDKGVGLLKNDSIQFFNSKNEFISNAVYDFCEDKGKNIYIATSKGLCLYQNNSFYSLDIKNTGNDKVINCVSDATEAGAWASTSSELFNVILSKKSYTVNRFNQEDFIASGVLKPNCLSIVNNCPTALVDDQLLTYTPFKFSFLKEDLELNLVEVSIEDLDKNWVQLREDKIADFDYLTPDKIPFNLRLSPDEYTLKFDFDANYWGKENKLTFYYKLIGLNTKWIGPIVGRDLTFNSLKQGSYTLLIKGISTEKINIRPISYSFIIKSYFYQSAGFIIFLAGISILLIFLAFKTFTKFSFKNLESYTSLNFTIKKARFLSIAGFIVFPLVEYLEGNIQKLYEANWHLVYLTMVLCTIAFLATYYKKLTLNIANTLIYSIFSIISVAYAQKCFSQGANPTLTIEYACFLLFAGVIFNSTRALVLFFASVAMVCCINAFVYNPLGANLNLLISVLIQVALVVIIEHTVKFTSANKFNFSNKILENTDLIVVVADINGKIIYVNNYTLDLLNRKESELLGDGWWQMRGFNTTETIKAKSVIRESIVSHKNSQNENSIFLEDRRIDILWNDYIIDGKFQIGIGKDTTNDNLLKQEVTKLSNIATSIKNGIVITDAEGRIKWCNRSYEDITGFNLLELVGHRPGQFLRTPDFFAAQLREVVKNSSELNRYIKAAYFNKKGDLIWLLVTATPVYESTGELKEIIEVCVDITEQKKLEDQYQFIVDNANDIIYTANKEGRFTFLNKAITQILGYETEELIGRHLSEIIHPDDVKRVSVFYYKQFSEKEENSYLEFKILNKLKEQRYVGQKIKLVADENNNLTFQAVVRDITAQKEEEIQENIKKEKTKMYASVLKDLTALSFNENNNGFESSVQEIIKKSASALRVQRCSLWDYEVEMITCRFLHVDGSDNLSAGKYITKKDHPDYFKGIELGQILYFSDVNAVEGNQPNVNYLAANGIKSVLTAPIFREGNVTAILVFSTTKKIKNWDEEDINFAKSITDLIAISTQTFERKQAETAIKVSESNFRLLNETIDDVFWLFDILNSKMLYLSPSSIKVLSIREEDYFKQNYSWLNHVLEEDTPVIFKAYKNLTVKGWYDIEYRIRSKDGVRWIHEKSFGIKDENGKYIKSSGVCSDITNKKNLESKLQRLSLVAEKTNNAIVITCPKGNIEWVNEAFVHTTGYKLNEVIGKKPGSFLQGELSEAETIKRISKNLREKRSIKEELVNYSKEGTSYWVELNIDPVFDKAGTLINFIAVKQNITERKLKEQLIASQNLDILDSIKYAKRIQNALLPSQPYLESLPLDISLFYKPKDIIGGDFYWVDTIDNHIIIALGDCTGHGVPGALMTSLGINGLINCVTEQKQTDPGYILNYIDKYITTSLATNDPNEEINDGMDLAIVTIDLDKKNVKFSGAGRPLIFIKDNALNKINGSKKAIGYKLADYSYNTITLDDTDNCTFYLFSDGMVDQYDSLNRKRLGSKKFMELTLRNNFLSLNGQKEQIYNFYREWKGITPQTDDMIWMSFKLNN